MARCGDRADSGRQAFESQSDHADLFGCFERHSGTRPRNERAAATCPGRHCEDRREGHDAGPIFECGRKSNHAGRAAPAFAARTIPSSEIASMGIAKTPGNPPIKAAVQTDLVLCCSEVPLYVAVILNDCLTAEKAATGSLLLVVGTAVIRMAASVAGVVGISVPLSIVVVAAAEFSVVVRRRMLSHQALQPFFKHPNHSLWCR